jgi:hypothetical protein
LSNGAIMAMPPEIDRMLAGRAQHTALPGCDPIAGAPLLAKLVGTAISPRDQ